MYVWGGKRHEKYNISHSSPHTYMYTLNHFPWDMLVSILHLSIPCATEQNEGGLSDGYEIHVFIQRHSTGTVRCTETHGDTPIKT